MYKRFTYTILAVSFLVVWIWAAIEPLHFDDWLLENILVFITLPIIFFTHKRFEFSILSYLLITLFMMLHVIGSHYTYAEVPWGVTLGELLGADRNMYDRLVHLLFGVLLVYPIREIFIRTVKISGFWAYFVPFMIVSALSGIYEVIEWGAAEVVDPEAGIAFLGSQGDIWDAQKDMLLAKVGALWTLGVVWVFRRVHFNAPL
ncbi:DUF2238 domain-containing protein [Sulfurovum sp. bin170]|uniref:DUF2238 domain-containing protein n=1 Tax=Sulfurovum sp. bin170 TaxID=2695268 RepID=UPI001CB6D8A0|nr:DUF2238 domain-containing protein [Sulfurovum sp. bin170]